MNDISIDFEKLRVSALKKASKISGSINGVTIGPDSTVDTSNDENIENEQNNCNIGANNQSKNKSIKSSNKSEFNQSSRLIKCGVTFSVKKILLENELQRRENVRKAVEKRRQDMEKSEKALQQELMEMRECLAAKRAQEEAAELARIEAEEERLNQQNEMKRRHELQLQAQRLQEREARLEKQAAEQKIFKERVELLEKIKNSFKERCREIGILSKSCKDKNSVIQIITPFTNKLKELNQQIEVLNEKARKGELAQADVPIAEYISRQSEEVLNHARTEIAKADAIFEEELAKRQQEEQIRLQQQQQQQQQQINQDAQQRGIEVVDSADQSPESPPNVEATPENVSNNAADNIGFSQKHRLQIYINDKTFLEQYEESYRDFVQSTNIKAFRFDCKKAVGSQINQLTFQGGNLMEKYSLLKNLLQGNGTPNLNQYPQSFSFCKNVLARHIVNQGETNVSDKPESAFPIAAVAVALCCDFPDILQLFLAHFHTICPYIIPLFLPKLEGQTHQEYSTFLGYKIIDGTIESHQQFLHRMSGYVKLYAAILITPMRKNDNKPHPHGLKNAWILLASVLNLEPMPEFLGIKLTLIVDLLTTAGNAMYNAYPKQFLKLISFLRNQYLPQLQNFSGDCDGPKGRLEIFLETLSKNPIPPPPFGQLPPNFW